MAIHLALWYLALGVVALLVVRKARRRSTLPLPPGPPGLPILGNALDMPKSDMPEKLRQMSAKYGDIMHLDVFGQPIIVLNSHEAAIDLLEKRSANYSDRSPSPMVDISGFEWGMPVQQYGSWWRRHRRAFHQYFSQKAVADYTANQKLEAHRFVRRLIDAPQDFSRHIRHYFGSSIMRVTYGIDVDEEKEDYVTMAEDVMVVFSSIFTPGKYLVETFPSLRFLPAWMPGAGFKRDGAFSKKVVGRFLDVPWRAAMDAMRKGTARPSMATGLMEQIGELDEAAAAEEEIVNRNAAATAYAGGADTTLSTVQSFFLAMLLFPEVQKKAQEELMKVVGPHRLPEYDDEESLPYIRALAKECLRWRSVVPLSVPHRSIEDDEYRGYFIPKGSIIIPNIWSFSRDPAVYDDPEAFNPDRFLKDGKLNLEVRDPATIAFGYGRRICPGRYFAESSLFMVVATVLHTLSISTPIDSDGKPILPSGKMVIGLLAYPEPFDCVIKPRSAEGEALVKASCNADLHEAQSRS